jgi:hypothetical protein
MAAHRAAHDTGTDPADSRFVRGDLHVHFLLNVPFYRMFVWLNGTTKQVEGQKQGRDCCKADKQVIRHQSNGSERG